MFSSKQFAKGGNRTRSLPVYVPMGEGISPQTIGVLNVHFVAKIWDTWLIFLYDSKYDCQMSYFWSTLGYNNYSYLGYNAAGVTGGYQVDWMKELLAQLSAKSNSTWPKATELIPAPSLINVDLHSSCVSNIICPHDRATLQFLIPCSRHPLSPLPLKDHQVTWNHLQWITINCYIALLFLDGVV